MRLRPGINYDSPSTIDLGKYNCKEACFLGMSSIACIVKLPIQLEIRCIMVMQPASQLLYNNLYWIGDTGKKTLCRLLLKRELIRVENFMANNYMKTLFDLRSSTKYSGTP